MRLRETIRSAARATLDLLLPVVCVGCDRLLTPGETGIVCGLCWSRVSTLPHPQCRRCGHPLKPGTCKWCELLPAWVRCVRSYCWMPSDPANAIVHALKYDGWPRVSEAMAERMARLSWPPDVAAERSAIVPVPLHGSRLRERGFNQSALLAHSLALRWDISAHDDALVRTRATTSQTRLTPVERNRNVSGCFRIAPHAENALRGAHVILVDDVVTTAATLNACAEALLQGGVRIVSYATFGRARG